MSKKKTNFELALSVLQGDNRLPPIPCKKVERSNKDKEKERNQKHKKKITSED